MLRKETNRQERVEIPLTSPYCDRIRSLRMELDFAPYGSPEREYILCQIDELNRRAVERVFADRRLGT